MLLWENPNSILGCIGVLFGHQSAVLLTKKKGSRNHISGTFFGKPDREVFCPSGRNLEAFLECIGGNLRTLLDSKKKVPEIIVPEPFLGGQIGRYFALVGEP